MTHYRRNYGTWGFLEGQKQAGSRVGQHLWPCLAGQSTEAVFLGKSEPWQLASTALFPAEPLMTTLAGATG